MSSKQLKPWGSTAEGYLVFTIKSKQYFLKNNKFFNIGDGKEAVASIQMLFHRTIAKEVVKSEPDVLKKTDNKEIESIVRGFLKRSSEVDIATTKLIISIRVKIIAMRLQAIAATKKLLNLQRKRVSINDINSTLVFNINENHSALMHGNKTINFRKV